jgi:hypothetical protein
MIEIIKEIILTAQSLEVRGLGKIASKLDDAAESLTMVKQAQYDGIQGYWIRNGRCFDNCYRQKRTEEAKKSAQEIWTECHSEWLDSLMTKSSDWDKYAGNSSDNFIKIASSNTAKTSDEVMNDEIRIKIASGMLISDAVPMTIAERMFSIPWKIAQVSNDILDIAREVSDKDPAISERLFDFAERIRQESLNNYKDCLIS